MNRYVKKPIAIEAVKWKGFNNDEIKDFAGDSVKIEVIREGDADRGIPPCIDCSIKTLEGVMTANVGDYIIKGVNGEFYPCRSDIFEKTYLHEDEMGNISDGYHTFNELYKYRMLYNAAFFNELAKGDIKVCKSHKHHDGEECFGGGWFIVMAELPTGQISNHYENRYWELFDVPVLDKAWEWDGHTPDEASTRLENYIKIKDSSMGLGDAINVLKRGGVVRRRGWNGKNIVVFKQVLSHVDSNIIPEMQSLPDKAKDIIMDGSGFIDYTSQCLIYNKDSGRADSWVPSISDVFADDWEEV